MSFIEASTLSKGLEGLVEKNICLKTSASLHQLHVYLKAFGVSNGINFNLKNIDYGTLKQSLYDNDSSNDDIYILFPWDFFGGLDWRTGVSLKWVNIRTATEEVDVFFDLMLKKGRGFFFYLDTDLPPVMGLNSDIYLLKDHISLSARKLNCTMLSSSFFCLKTYLSNGCPFSSVSLSHVGKTITSNYVGDNNLRKKVIVTDLDYTFWHGVLGEVGSEGIEYSSNGQGYMYFIYQTFLKKLKNSGILLSICSKNDIDLVESAFKENDFVLNHNDFVAIQATYNLKSSQIKKLSQALNIGLHDFVFIDDNPIEIEEVKTVLPTVKCIQFPKKPWQLPNMLEELHNEFQISNITKEDVDRTNLYKRMQVSNVDSSNVETDIWDFLVSLMMEMEFITRTAVDNDRAIQLINKTNQFNLNGIRISKAECDRLVADGANLVTASLKDKNGDHGEVLVILIDKNNQVISFVMSCRVFQRQAEIMFLATLFSKGISNIAFNFVKTDRNEPFRLFLSKFFENTDSGKYHFTPELILDNYPNIHKLYKITENEYDFIK